MIFRHSLAIVFLFGAAVLGAPRSARAQACACNCPGARGGPFSVDSYDLIPVHPRIFADLTGYDPASLHWKDASGAEIAIVTEPAGAATEPFVWISPAATLAPDTDYQLSVNPSDSTRYAVTTPLHTFTTEGGFTAPAASSLRIVAPEGSPDLCYDMIGARFSFDYDGSSHPVLEVEVQRGTDVVAHLFLRQGAYLFGTPATDRDYDDCFRGLTIDGLTEGESLNAHVVVWDIAGGSSSTDISFTTYREAAIPDGTPCPYCSVSPRSFGAGPGVAGVILLGALGLLVRRRAR